MTIITRHGDTLKSLINIFKARKMTKPSLGSLGLRNGIGRVHVFFMQYENSRPITKLGYQNRIINKNYFSVSRLLFEIYFAGKDSI